MKNCPIKPGGLKVGKTNLSFGSGFGNFGSKFSKRNLTGVIYFYICLKQNSNQIIIAQILRF